jgi:hypothetical protein
MIYICATQNKGVFSPSQNCLAPSLTHCRIFCVSGFQHSLVNCQAVLCGHHQRRGGSERGTAGSPCRFFQTLGVHVQPPDGVQGPLHHILHLTKTLRRFSNLVTVGGLREVDRETDHKTHLHARACTHACAHARIYARTHARRRDAGMRARTHARTHAHTDTEKSHTTHTYTRPHNQTAPALASASMHVGAVQIHTVSL